MKYLLLISICFVCICPSISQAQAPKKSPAAAQRKVNRPQKKPAPVPSPQTREKSRDEPIPKIDKLGIIIKRLSTWWDGKWPASSRATLVKVERDLLKFLRNKSSGSEAKLEVVKLDSAEEATSKGITLLYAIDYREEGVEIEEKDFPFTKVKGGTADISCTFERIDQLNIATNWDNLSIDVRGYVWGNPYADFSEQAERRQLIFLANFVSAIPVLEITRRSKNSALTVKLTQPSSPVGAQSTELTAADTKLDPSRIGD